VPKRKKSPGDGGTIGGIQLLQIWETLGQLGASSPAMRRIVGRRPDDLERLRRRRGVLSRVPSMDGPRSGRVSLGVRAPRAIGPATTPALSGRASTCTR
jgi:hypothetical protein